MVRSFCSFVIAWLWLASFPSAESTRLVRSVTAEAFAFFDTPVDEKTSTLRIYRRALFDGAQPPAANRR